MARTRPLLATLVASLVLCANAAWSAEIDPFIGEYQGRANAETTSGDQARDLGVVIDKTDKGFVVKWKTVISKASGKVSSREYSVNFEPSGRDDIYASAMKPGLFGGSKPLDPMKGDPYVWARINDNTLTVYAMLITDSGEYEMQVYERTLVDGNLKLDFTRYRRSKVLSRVEAILKKRKSGSSY